MSNFGKCTIVVEGNAVNKVRRRRKVLHKIWRIFGGNGMWLRLLRSEISIWKPLIHHPKTRQGSHIIKLKSFKLHHIQAHINTFHKSRRFAVTAISRTLLRPPNNITFLNDPSCISASVTDRLRTIGSFAKWIQKNGNRRRHKRTDEYIYLA